MLKSSNGKSRQSGRRSVNDKVCDEVWDEVWNPRQGRAFHQPPRIVKSRTRTTTRTRTKPRKGRAFPHPSAPSNREIEDEDDDEDEDEAPQGTGLPAAFSLSRPTYSASPAALIHATAHFIAFFVAHFVVYASSHVLSALPARRLEHGPASPSMKNPPTNPEAPVRSCPAWCGADIPVCAGADDERDSDEGRPAGRNACPTLAARIRSVIMVDGPSHALTSASSFLRQLRRL